MLTQKQTRGWYTGHNDKMDTSDQYLNTLCRTCMNEVATSSYDGNTKPQQQWLTIFDIIEECGALRITELLNNAVPQIQLRLSEELPTKICCNCLQQLLSAYRFQQMCIQSEEQLREVVSKKHTYLKTSLLKAAREGAMGTDSCALEDSYSSSMLKDVQHPSMQDTLLEARGHVIKTETEESSGAGNLQAYEQLMEYRNDSQGELGESIKNEPIQEDEANIEYSDGDTIHSAISVKDEIFSIDSEEQQIDKDSPQYNCHLCNKSYNDIRYLHIHLSHHGSKVNSQKYYQACDLCGKTYTSRLNLMKHLKKKHSIDTPDSELIHFCEICEKGFKTASALKRHVRTHTGERPYSCPECDKSFSTSCNLKRHRRSHGEDKPYECPYCPLRFSSNTNIARHRQIHEGVELHACDICGKTMRKTDLKEHKQIHTGDRPHKCDICGKRFIRNQQLRGHMRTHTGEKPFKCKYCERVFTSRSQRTQHLRTHLGNNIHRCELCPLAFPLLSEMRLHFATHKNEDPETHERNMKALREEEAKLELKMSQEKTQSQLIEEQQHEVKIECMAE